MTPHQMAVLAHRCLGERGFEKLLKLLPAKWLDAIIRSNREVIDKFYLEVMKNRTLREETERRMALAETLICQKIGRAAPTPEAFFDLRFDLARDWLGHRHTGAERDRIERSRAFWWWWRTIWLSNDLEILHFIDQNPDRFLDWESYEQIHRTLFAKYDMMKTLHRHIFNSESTHATESIPING